MFCINCGKQIADGSTFCSECGVTQSARPIQPQPQYHTGLACPRCGSNNVRTEQKQAVNVSVKMKRGNGCLWWLLLGWIYLIYVMCVWTFKLMYFICIGWWVAILKKSKQAADANTVVHLCQNCGNKWETR